MIQESQIPCKQLADSCLIFDYLGEINAKKKILQGKTVWRSTYKFLQFKFVKYDAYIKMDINHTIITVENDSIQKLSNT